MTNELENKEEFVENNLELGKNTDHWCIYERFLGSSDEQVSVLDPNKKWVVLHPAHGDWIALCNCGLSWTHKKEMTIEQMKSIYISHVAYSKHKSMETI